MQQQEEYGFIFPRCIREPKHANLWKECYNSIRTFFPEAPIIIIDDNSRPELIDGIFEASLRNTSVYYNHEYPGAGELLPYIYLHNKMPFKKAVCLNDSMFVQEREHLAQAIQDTKEVSFLWDFGPMPDPDFIHQQYEMIQALHPGCVRRIHHLFTSLSGWSACFATASIITLDFLNTLQEKYRILNLTRICRSRPYRCSLERIFGLCCYDHRPSGIPVVFGSSLVFNRGRSTLYSFEEYLEDKKNGVHPNRRMVKVWNSR